MEVNQLKSDLLRRHTWPALSHFKGEAECMEFCKCELNSAMNENKVNSLTTHMEQELQLTNLSESRRKLNFLFNENLPRIAVYELKNNDSTPGRNTPEEYFLTNQSKHSICTKCSLPIDGGENKSTVPICDNPERNDAQNNGASGQTGTGGIMSLQKIQSSRKDDIRKVITLWQNYYPEGEWGWIVVLCAFIVQAINHGIQLSASALTRPVIQKFSQEEPTLLGNNPSNQILRNPEDDQSAKANPESGTRGGCEGGGSGAKKEQELNDPKKRSDWRTLQQHYYPEGGWGWIITFCAVASHVLAHGIQLCFSSILIQRFNEGWLGAASMSVSLLLSPIWVSICKRKSTRLAAVFGGLVASLGCLFTSFASQFHQLFISYGAFIGVGVGLTRDASSLMVGQYFKRKRELVEIIVVSGSGLGILLMSISIHTAISSLGWRIGLQAITGSLFITFFLGTCYRSASLYHPQRRAILHLKNQKRKIKEKEKREDKPPFLDFACLRSKTLQILLLSSGVTAFGINTPLFYLAVEYENEMVKVDEESKRDEFSLILLHIGVGTSWILGCVLFGLIVIQKNQDCRVSKQYLCQLAGVICGISILALTAVEGFNGLIIFSSVYGFSLGGYNYALKVYTYERVRARHFPRAWSFIQSAQAIPLFLGVPLSGYMNTYLKSKSGYYVSALSVIIGSICLFLTDVRRRRLSRRKAQNSSMKTCETLESAQSPKIRRLSFAFPIEIQLSPQSKQESNGEGGQTTMDPAMLAKELTCISEEGIADMDFQDIYFEEWAEYFGADCITSCNKVENCLVSEYDPEYPMIMDRKSRRWSAARPNLAQATSSVAGCIAGIGQGVGAAAPVSTSSHPPASPSTAQPRIQMTAPREIPSFRNPRSSRLPPGRSITVIDEAEASV